MINPTHTIVSGESLLDNYKVHYNFETYSGGAGNEHIYSDADVNHSGKIFAISDSTDPTSAIQYFTGDGGTGTFSGGLNQFYDHVVIDNTDNLFSGEFTFIIGAQTTSRQDVGENPKGPVSNNNILFSNFSGSGNLFRGWQFGINAANRAYVDLYENLQPKNLTYMGSKTPFSHNLWQFRYRNEEVSVGLFDITTQKVTYNSTPIPILNLQNSESWKIGSGINYDPLSKFSDKMTLNSGLLAGKMDTFVYFNTGLSDEQSSSVIKSIYSDLNEATAASYTGISGLITGRASGVSLQTGIIGETYVCTTGSETGSITFTGSVPLTGDLTSGEVYYVFSTGVTATISGVEDVYQALYNTGYPTTGITGFSTITHVSGLTGDIVTCSGSGVTGVVSSGYIFSNLTGDTGQLLLSSATYNTTGTAPTLFRPDAFSYIRDEDSYEVEKYNADAFEIANTGALNKEPNVAPSRLDYGNTLTIDTARPENTVSYYLEGIARQLGIPSITSRTETQIITSDVLKTTYALTPTEIISFKDATPLQITGIFNAYNIVSGDYSLSGMQILDNLRFANESGVAGVVEYANTVAATYDVSQPTGIRSEWTVSSTYEYDSPPSPNPISGDQFVFFNGQKLISGVDYVQEGGDFFPTGFVTGLTGTYFTMPPIPDATRVTGNDTSFYSNSFWPNSNAVFLNGVRQNANAYYIEHSTTKDLISGRETAATELVRVYNSTVLTDSSS